MARPISEVVKVPGSGTEPVETSPRSKPNGKVPVLPSWIQKEYCPGPSGGVKPLEPLSGMPINGKMWSCLRLCVEGKTQQPRGSCGVGPRP